ncbi:MAG: hypothetical protein IPH20_19765 [Bacteroidales bacterium]|nr:hypothetical protein [Bacteroidales bacterium]
MKTFNSLFVLMIGFSSLLANAQKADSVIVIYDNQKTVIPVPAFGSQTTVKMADSIQIIEIGVSRKRAGDKSTGMVQANDLFIPDNKTEKARKQVKWFSQIEVGYKKCFSAESGWGYTSYTNQDGIPVKLVYDVNMSDITGYQLRVLLRENVTMLRERISFNSGFKLGYAQSFSNAYTNDSEYDTTGNLLSDTSRFYNFRSNNFQLVYEAGFAYHFKAFKQASTISIGNSFSYSIIWVKDVNDLERGSNYLTSFTSLVHPYLGAEIGKFGFRISMD